MLRKVVSVALFAATIATPLAARANGAENGKYLNGKYLNTDFLNGKYLNGRRLAGGAIGAALPAGGTIGATSVPPLAKNGAWVAGAWLDGSQIVAAAYDGAGGWRFERGAWLKGARLHAEVVEPSGAKSPVELTITDVEIETAGRLATGILRQPYARYYVEAKLDAGSEPLCGRDGNQRPIPAIALAGEWNGQSGHPYGGARVSASADRITFGCVDAALGKCADGLAYGPWESDYVQECTGSGCTWVYRDLSDAHQACTRMVRADYCGDGESHTNDGFRIDVYDDVGMRPQAGGGLLVDGRRNRPTVTANASWLFEASWTKDGAKDANCSRLQQGVTTCPSYALLPGGGVRRLPTYLDRAKWSCPIAPEQALYSSAATVANYRFQYASPPIRRGW